MFAIKLCSVHLLSILISPSLSVPYGENCHPLIPSLHCDQDAGLTCVQQFDGMFLCLCGQEKVVNADGRSCSYIFDRTCYYEPGRGCNTDRGLYCQSAGVVLPYGHCVCSDRASIWGRDREACVGLAGTTCDPATQDDEFGQGCVPNATCNGETLTCVCDPGFEEDGARRCVKTEGLIGAPCTTNQDCDWSTHRLECNSNNNVCECARSQGYHSMQNGTCVRDYGTSCSSVDPCDPERFQRCTSWSAAPGSCVCKAEDQMEYNVLTEECSSLVGGSCGADIYNPGIGCIINAECVPLGEGSNSRCQCLSGFIPSIDNRECVQRPNL